MADINKMAAVFKAGALHANTSFGYLFGGGASSPTLQYSFRD